MADIVEHPVLPAETTRAKRRRAALPLTIVAGAGLLTIAGLFAIATESDVAKLRERDRVRQKIDLSARSLQIELEKVASDLDRIDITTNGIATLNNNAADEFVMIAVLSASGEMLIPAPPVGPKAISPVEHERVTTFLEEAAYREFTINDAREAALAFENAALAAKDPRLGASVAMSRAGFATRNGKFNEAEKHLSDLARLVEQNPNLESPERALPVRMLLGLLQIQLSLQKGERGRAAEVATNLLAGPFHGDAVAIVEEIAAAAIVTDMEIAAARARALEAKNQSAILNRMLRHAKELASHPGPAAAFENALFIVSNIRDGRRVAAEIDPAAFAGRHFSQQITASETPIAFSQKPGELVNETAVAGTDGLLRIGLARDAAIPEVFNQSIYYALGFLVILLGGSVGAGAWLLYRAANREIEAAQAKSEFLSGVTHELKTPLASIRLYGEMLANGSVRDTTKQKEYIETIGREAERLTILIDRVLSLAKLERPRESVSMDYATAAELFKTVEDSFRPVADRANLEFNIQRAGADVHIAADPVATSQAILDLLDNARKYASSGKIIELNGQRSGNSYMIEVADRGPGVPEGDRERLFQMFARGIGDSVRGTAGLGIGLALARRIVHSSGGNLTVRNREGGGAVFMIELAVAENINNKT
ncbi:MAG: sensor histidine kinase [Planctomycetota bacterium]